MGRWLGTKCKYGQTAVADGGERLPARKATRWMGGAPEILKRVGLKCRGGRASPSTSRGGRAAATAIYPPQLCIAILRGAEAQRRREGRPLPEQAMSALEIWGLSEPAGGPASTGVAPSEWARDDLPESHAKDEQRVPGGVRWNRAGA